MQNIIKEGLNSFLDTSSIGGLNHISTSKKYVRIFWVITVLSAFAGAGFLMNLSFNTWAKTPEKTTIATLPITEIRLPKITVCPPRNTYTDLNYYVMLAENKTLTG